MSAEDRTPRRQRVVFVDWWGVLSLDPYWRSIRTDPSHLLHAQLEIYIGGVLARNDPRGMAWMRGAISSDRIVSAIGPTSDTDRDTTLLDTLVRDIESMTVNTELTALLADLRSRAFVVVATDNIDCFADTFRRLHRDAAPWPPAAPATLSATVGLFDGIICSSDLGLRKKEDPSRFFGGWLAIRPAVAGWFK